MNARALVPGRIPPSWGRPLSQADYAALSASWITPEMADAAMLRRVDEIEGREIVGRRGSLDCAGLLIPYYLPGETHPNTYRIRRDNPDLTVDKDGKPKPDRKYLGSPESGNRLFFPPGVTLAQLQDVTVPIIIVEGEKKALALQRLAYHDSVQPRFIPVAIPGVWNWRGVVGKAGGARGGRVPVKGPITDLGRISWGGRTVFILFDTNVHSNESVQAARRGLTRHLVGESAKVKHINLPEDCGVNGVDDLLAIWSPDRVLELIHQATDGGSLEIVPSPQFESRPTGMFRITQQGEQFRQTQLTNYQASITANVLLDDGVEARCEFEIKATLLGRSYGFSVPASEFSSMNWAIGHLGPAAITFPNQREYARAAIQWNSMTAEERSIYTHTGWRRVNGSWLFLHGGGAIGGVGSISDVNVRLSGSLSRYELRSPSGPEALIAAIKASLCLVEIGPPAISFPLLAATFRAVFGEADFSLHLTGATGAFKSELAALHQQFFGTTMSRLHLPGNWSSTGNAIEVLAFQAKDTLLVVDDFAPHGSTHDVARYHAAADRVFRAAGNHAGRGRLDSTSRLREAKPPRALILSTGEDVPRGQSLRARLLILETSKGAIRAEDLTGCQQDAQAGLYALAMGGFVQYVAGRHDDIFSEFEQKVSEYRAAAFQNPAHARTPDIVANLQAGLEMYVDFCVASGAITAATRDELVNRCWAALHDAAAAQAKHQAATEPAARYLSLLRSLLNSGRAHLAVRNGGEPDWHPESCGWRRDAGGQCKPLGECIGWVHRDDVYLDPTAAYRLVQSAGRDGGEGLSVSEQTLNKRLHEKGLLASVEESRGTLTVRRRICGTSKDVLHFDRVTLLPEQPDDEGEEEG